MELSPIYPMQPIPYFGETLTGEWIYEPKIDGWRLQIIKYKDGRIEFWGRRLEKRPNWTKNLFYLARFLKDLPEGVLLDSELYSTKGRRGIPSVFARTGLAEPLVYVFDIVFFEGKFIGDKPLKERKKILSKIKLNPPFYLLEYKLLQDWEEALTDCLTKGFEGIVMKDLSSPYILTREAPMATHHWRKIKG